MGDAAQGERIGLEEKARIHFELRRVSLKSKHRRMILRNRKQNQTQEVEIS